MKRIKTRKRKTKRTCLRCDREFLSEGKFNRICPNCREINANIALINDASDSVIGNDCIGEGCARTPKAATNP